MSHDQSSGSQSVVYSISLEVWGNANHLELNSAVAQGMRSLHNSSLFSCDNEDTDSVAKAESGQLSLRLPLGRVLRVDGLVVPAGCN